MGPMDGTTLVIVAGGCAGVVMLGAMIGSILHSRPMNLALWVAGCTVCGAMAGALVNWIGWGAYEAAHAISMPASNGLRYVMVPLPNVLNSDRFRPDTIIILVGASLGGAVGAIMGACLGARACRMGEG